MRNQFPLDLDSLTEGDKVRRDEKPGPVVCRPTNGVGHCANRSFAVGPGNVDDARMAETDSDLGDEPPNVFQSELDSEALKPIEPGERLRVIDWCVSRSAYPRGPGRRWRGTLAGSPRRRVRWTFC